MVQVSYPGVYIQEVSSGVKTITGVATSITAFFGRTSKGPVNRAVRCLSYADYIRNFGPPHPASDLAASVRQFYDNGGSDCYVVRLAKGAVKASANLESYGSQAVLTATAKADGEWANTVRLAVDYNTVAPGESFNLTVIHEAEGRVVATETHTNLSMDYTSPRFAPNFVTQSSQLITLQYDPADLGDFTDAASVYRTTAFDGFSQGRRPLGADGAAVKATLDALVAAGSYKFDISVNGSAYVGVDLSTISVIPSTVADIESELKDLIEAQLGTLPSPATVDVSLSTVTDVGRLLTIESSSGTRASVRVRRSSSNDIAVALMLGVDQGGIELARYSNFRPMATGTLIAPGTGLGFPAALTALDALAGIAQTGGLTEIEIDGETVALDGSGDYNIETVPGARWVRNAVGNSAGTGDNDGVREKLRLIANAINNHPTLAYTANTYGYYLSITPDDGALTKQAVVAATGTANATLTGALLPNVRRYTLSGGNDGTVPGYDEYIGSAVDQTGFHALDTVDLFNLMVLPPDAEIAEADHNELWGPASIYCRSRRAFLIIDAPPSWGDDGKAAIVQDTAQINDLRATAIKDFSAVFFPRIKYNASGLIKLTGSGGAIAGLMARTDASRGVWKAPAGTEADLRGIAGLEVKLTDLENGVLNKLGVNCARVFPTGFVNWGARTFDGADDFGSEWKYIPIRRLALMIEESLFRGTQWVVFEPNDEPLWARVRLNVGAFMMGLFRQGAFQGSSPDQAFFVKCDAETTTQNDRNLGIVNIQVGFAPLKPAEFVVITIQQIAGDLS